MRKNWMKGIFLTVIISTLFVLTAAAGWEGVGTVTGDGLRLRSEANAESTVLATAGEGSKVIVLESAQNGWYKVSFTGKEGFMSAEYLDVVSVAEDAELGRVRVTTSGDPLNLRSGAGTDKSILARIPNGSVVELTGYQDGWCKVTYGTRTGYVSADYVTPTGDEANSGTELGAKVVAEAMKHLGKPYRSGAKGPNSFDCSGFCQYVYKQFGISLPGGSTTQWRTAPGTRVKSISELQPGDLFFIRDPAYAKGYATSHVGIYIGNNQIIHASDRNTGVIITNVSGKYVKYFVGGIHVG